jgi:hypothetical protein
VTQNPKTDTEEIRGKLGQKSGRGDKDDACKQRGPAATREAPAVIAFSGQLATRESQAGPCGVAERSVVPKKPDNAGRGKGP